MPEAEEEEDEAQVLRKLKPKIPDHNDAHLVAEAFGRPMLDVHFQCELTGLECES